MKIILASQSPRRKELLQSLGYDFQTVSIDVEEVFPADLPAENVAGYLSELKANAFRKLEKDEVLITADTVVVQNHEILGKPGDRKQAFEMIKKLSGNSHQVFTAVTIKTSDKSVTKTDVSTVDFLEITDDEINFYIDRFQPFDKAGSYGIQEWIGMAKISRINGSFYTIMGLPTHLVEAELSKLK